MHIRVLLSWHADLDIPFQRSSFSELGRRRIHENRRRVTMTSKIIKYALWAGMLISALSVSRFVASLDARQAGASATDALQKARVLDRLAAAMQGEHKGTAEGGVPKFEPDPYWPKVLPHNWIFGQVGGVYVDSQA